MGFRHVTVTNASFPGDAMGLLNITFCLVRGFIRVEGLNGVLMFWFCQTSARDNFVEVVAFRKASKMAAVT
jgi:hypothetical protein